ncbi:MAG TPA: PIN domain-containing protein [Bryobacteraceae bacterium]|nr:PIN domain-containing protein [Bryobacteraceae bacterium]
MLDTCVVASALRSRNGASNRLLRLVFLGKVPAVCHYKLLAEYHEVLFRMVKQREVGYSKDQVERLLAAFVTVAHEAEVRFLWRPNLPDEGDNFIYEVAFAASPSTIVTHNVRDFRKPEIEWPGVLVKTPRQVLIEVSGHA